MATAQRKYRGKYPNRICGYAGTYTKGVYSVTVNCGARYYVAAADARAAGYTHSMQQLMGMDIADVPYAHVDMLAAVAAQYPAQAQATATA